MSSHRAPGIQVACGPFDTRDSQGFLALGLPLEPPLHSSLWRSGDGLTWQEMQLTPAAAFATDSSHYFLINRVARMGDTLVAVGIRALGDGSSGDSKEDPAAWVSTDAGATWRQATGTGFTDGVIEDVAFGPGGWVAVGSDGYTTRGAAVWTSPDGLRWTRVTGQPALKNGRMSNILATGPGYMAVGNSISGAPEVRAAVWTSPDGVHWSQPSLDFPGAIWGWSSAGIVEWNGRDVIFTRPIGSVPPNPLVTTVWSTPDGLTWARAGQQSGEVNGVTVALPNALATVGSLSEAGPGGRAAWVAAGLWTSVDGRSWQQAPLIESFVGVVPHDATYAAGRLVIVGEGAVLVGAPAP
jgi:hypothetical protein